MAEITASRDSLLFYDDTVKFQVLPGSDHIQTSPGISLLPGIQLNFLLEQEESRAGNGFDFELEVYDENQGRLLTHEPIEPKKSDGPIRPNQLKSDAKIGLSLPDAAKLLFGGSIRHSAHGQSEFVSFSALVRIRILEQLINHKYTVRIGDTDLDIVFERYGKTQFKAVFEHFNSRVDQFVEQ